MKRNEFEMKLYLMGFKVTFNNNIWLPYVKEDCEIYPSKEKYSVIFKVDGRKFMKLVYKKEDVISEIIKGLSNHGALQERATKITKRTGIYPKFTWVF